MPSASLRLAVIGAGAAGLAAARELRREGHAPVVFERAAAVGGTWLYAAPAAPSDPLGAAATHSSLYASLRTNLPRETMGFLDFPFAAEAPGSADPRRFPGHEEVLRYLEAFARRFDLLRLVRFETEVLRVRRQDRGGWAEEVYDAVVVCNGHYTEPRIAVIQDTWPGKQVHSHNYCVPESFLDQVCAFVLVIYAPSSAFDISRDVSSTAKEVHIADMSAPVRTCEKQLDYNNLWLHSMIDCAEEDGSVVFQDGSSIKADVIMHCTGYSYDFPFLGDDSTITVDDNRINPLYKHVFPPEVAPQLSFIGLPWKWVARVLSGWIVLPSKEEMMEDVKALYSKLEARGWPKRYTHNFSNYQFEYDDWFPESYRDEWDDDHLVAEANEDFKKHL
ncbi:hypothetical protein PVAP13_9KG337757 [Panicum virgatum]|uniref:Flavin-containing monooxygenase n=1 Tax=Panicum virgatum TaxID=38727 RepID=A0A8T0NTW2_PANVG|nr:hypothetical protein PVAP13_9KG337757 [Panicum virgatum]